MNDESQIVSHPSAHQYKAQAHSAHFAVNASVYPLDALAQVGDI
jgi:hypothetical protein